MNIRNERRALRISSRPAGRLDIQSAPLAAHLSRDKILSIEGLRGVLALTVCIGHVGLNTIANRVGLQIKFDLAVDVFFALSGFVLAQSYYFGRRTFAELVRGRIARLYPLHALTLLWFAVLYNTQATPVDPLLFWQNVFLVQNVGLPPNRWDFNFPSWSISVEMAMSLLFYFVLRRDTRTLWGGLVVAGVIISSFASTGGLGAAENYLGVFNSGLLRGVAGFSIGASTFMIVQRDKAIFHKCRFIATPLLILLSLFFIKEWSGASAGLFALVVLVFLAVSVSDDSNSILSSSPFVFLGSISYSVYLLHMPITSTIESLFPVELVRGPGKLLVLSAIILASTVCHRYFEVPMQRWLLSIMSSGRPVGNSP